MPHDEFAIAQEAMVEDQIVARGIRNPDVLDAMRKVPRHAFCVAEQKPYAYEDRPLPIGHGQTISQPYIVALMSELLQVQRHHSVLEIGTGSGYQAAVLSHLVSHLITIERISPLARRAMEIYSSLGYDSIDVEVADGYDGYAPGAPYDRILVTAAPEKIPPALTEQLAEGGRLVIPAGTYPQRMIVVNKRAGRLITEKHISVVFVPLRRGIDQG